MKTIIVPLTKEAELKLCYNQHKDMDIYQWGLTDEEFDLLFKFKVFYDIYIITGVWVDLAEDSVIQDKFKIADLLLFFSKKNKYKNRRVRSIVLKLMSSLELALMNDTGMYFYM